MKSRLLALTSAFVVLLGGMVASTAPAQAKAIEIGFAPSPNGVVMVNVPTQIAGTGFKGKAKVFRYDSKAKKWSLLGSVTNSTALPYTFKTPGIQTIKVVPATAKPRTVKVGVYQTYWWKESSPVNYGGTLLNSSMGGNGEDQFSARAKNGCVLFDAAAINKMDVDFAFQVVSSAPEVNVSIPSGSTVGAPNIPISGDAVLTILGPRNPGGYWGLRIGVGVTCLRNLP